VVLAKDQWKPLEGGLLGRSYTRARQAQTVVKEFTDGLGWD
jgi:hypothetical protein